MSGTCYDGKAFFAVDHPVYLNADGSGDAETVSNWLRPAAVDGTVTDGTPWFVLDVSRPLRPFIFQERTAPELQVITNPDNDYVFMKDKIPLRHPLPLQRRVRLLAAGRVQHAGAERRQFRRRP